VSVLHYCVCGGEGTESNMAKEANFENLRDLTNEAWLTNLETHHQLTCRRTLTTSSELWKSSRSHQRTSSNELLKSGKSRQWTLSFISSTSLGSKPGKFSGFHQRTLSNEWTLKLIESHRWTLNSSRSPLKLDIELSRSLPVPTNMCNERSFPIFRDPRRDKRSGESCTIALVGHFVRVFVDFWSSTFCCHLITVRIRICAVRSVTKSSLRFSRFITRGSCWWFFSRIKPSKQSFPSQWILKIRPQWPTKSSTNLATNRNEHRIGNQLQSEPHSEH
jgi:hypothetical protein